MPAHTKRFGRVFCVGRHKQSLKSDEHRSQGEEAYQNTLRRTKTHNNSKNPNPEDANGYDGVTERKRHRTRRSFWVEVHVCSVTSNSPTKTATAGRALLTQFYVNSSGHLFWKQWSQIHVITCNWMCPEYRMTFWPSFQHSRNAFTNQVLVEERLWDRLLAQHFKVDLTVLVKFGGESIFAKFGQDT